MQITDLVYTPSFTPEEEALVEREYQALREAYLASNHRKKVEQIDRAFLLARVAHGSTRRQSGEPYILHPIAVARIVCSELGMGSTTISCALLHDVVEDTDYTIEDIEELFDAGVARIVDGLTKVSKMSKEDAALAKEESMRKLLSAMQVDARVMLVKLADRLHNMRTMASMLPSKQQRISNETQRIYAPLADRLGLYLIKTELEDLSFKYEHPDSYAYIQSQIALTEVDRERLFEGFIRSISQMLDTRRDITSYEIKSRVKGCYSIWRKMQKLGLPFSEIYDLFAVRIVFDCQGIDEEDCCYSIFRQITRVYHPRPDRTRDWLSSPKGNGYQALHTTVVTPGGKMVEVQIRSRRMDDIAEQGIAAHWRYKGDYAEIDDHMAEWYDSIASILSNPSPEGMDLIEELQSSLRSKEVVVFTPKGKTVEMPKGATALDFAYALSRNIGNVAIAAKIDGQLAPLGTPLTSGAKVEIITTQKSQAPPQWRQLVITSKARKEIERELRQQMQAQAQEGERLLREHLEAGQVPYAQSIVDKLTYHFGFSRPDELLASIGKGTLSLTADIAPALRKKGVMRSMWDMVRQPFTRSKGALPPVPAQTSEPATAPEPINRKKVYTLTHTPGGALSYTPAPCCLPVPGDEVLGVVVEDPSGTGERVVVHLRSCPEAARIKRHDASELISTAWGKHSPEYLFEASLSIRGIDGVGVLHGITTALSAQKGVNIISLQAAARDGLFQGGVTLLVHDKSELETIVQVLGSCSGIDSVSRTKG